MPILCYCMYVNTFYYILLYRILFYIILCQRCAEGGGMVIPILFYYILLHSIIMYSNLFYCIFIYPTLF